MSRHSPAISGPSPTGPVVIGLLVLTALVAQACSWRSGAAAIEPMPAASARRERLGERIFADERLSEPPGTSCASCHEPRRGFSGNHGSRIGTARGSRADSIGLRNTPTLLYAAFTPAFSEGGGFLRRKPAGGFFLDGRAGTLEEQAAGPLLAPDEMGNPSAAAVADKIAGGPYADEFRAEFGGDVFTDPQRALRAACSALAAFERMPRFQPFTSRFDDQVRGTAALSARELNGMRLFFDPRKGNCASCHAADADSSDPRSSLFTDFSFNRLDVPRNRGIPADGDPAFFDLGLAGPKRTAPGGPRAAAGRFKTPTLRNAALKESFMHNGAFTSLEQVVAFYATRDTDPRRWYPAGRADDLPEEHRADDPDRESPFGGGPGDQPRLDRGEIDDVVRFLRTLTDAEFAPAAIRTEGGP